ncbi:MAG TPA: hypothetical protein VK726_27060 [Acetobacteraceae bacterium]|nr:hypothetical protein [Acetobacteraceae bacterium]
MIVALRPTSMLVQVMRWLDDLPPALAAWALEAPELYLAPQPVDGLTPQEVGRRAKAAWRQAVEAARQAWRETKGKPHVPVGGMMQMKGPSPGGASRADLSGPAGEMYWATDAKLPSATTMWVA